MRKNSNNPRKKLLLLLAPLACILVGAGIVIALQQHNHKRTMNPGNQIESHLSAAASSPKGSTPNTSYTPPVTNSGITLTPSISDNQVVITTKLVGYSDGTCSLTVTNGTRVNSQNADVIYAPSYSTCAGFTVPISDLGVGDWNIELSITSGGQSTSKAVTYRVTP